MRTLRILVVGEHRMLRDAIRERLLQETDFEVAQTLGRQEVALERLLDLAPDVAVVDVDEPTLRPFSFAERLRRTRPECRLVFLTTRARDADVREALRLDAEAFLTKKEPLPVLVEAIRSVRDGGTFFSEEIAARLAPARPEETAGRTRTRYESLTRRELEVLRLLAEGLRKREIARRLHVSLKTVEGHVEKIMGKLDLHDRVTLARFAIREGLVDP